MKRLFKTILPAALLGTLLCVSGSVYAEKLKVTGLKEAAEQDMRESRNEEAARDARTARAIQKFFECDEECQSRRDAESQSGQNSSSGGSSSASSSSSSSSSAKPTGVKDVYDAGLKSSKGHTVFRVKCHNGKEKSVWQENGKWFDYGVSSEMGDRYKGLSLGNFAEVYCK